MSGEHLVIIGNGGTAVSAVRTLRASGWRGEITIISREPFAHYSPILLPYYIEGRIEESALFHRGEVLVPDPRIQFIRGTAVIGVDTTGNSVMLEDGTDIHYDVLLIATGASPIVPAIPGHDNVDALVLRTLADARRIRDRDLRHTAIIGTGPVAVELGIALARQGKKVTLIGRSRVMRRIFSPAVAARIAAILTDNGVEVMLGQRDIALEPGWVVTVERAIDCDAVVIATGVRPNTDFLVDSGITIGDKGGIIVDSRMRTAVSGVYAAGDCVQAPDYLTGAPIINAIWPEAVEQGRIAALNILGMDAVYRGGIPRNVINIFDVPVLSVGYLSGDAKREEFPGGWITTYTHEGQVIGMEIIGELHQHGYLPTLYKHASYPDWLREAAVGMFLSSPEPRYPPRVRYSRR